MVKPKIVLMIKIRFLMKLKCFFPSIIKLPIKIPNHADREFVSIVVKVIEDVKKYIKIFSYESFLKFKREAKQKGQIIFHQIPA